MRRRLPLVGILVSAVALTVAGAVPAGAGVPTDAAEVTALQARLQGAADAGDVAGTRSALVEADTLLTTVHSAVESGARELVATADDAAADALTELDTTFPAAAARADLPPVPVLLNLLLQKVLAILAELIANLLGGLPAPIPPPIPVETP